MNSNDTRCAVIAMLWACTSTALGLWQAEPVPAPEDPVPAETEAEREPDTPTDEEADAVDSGPREVVLVLRGGREVDGMFLRETGDQVVLLIEGIETAFDKSDLHSMRELEPLLDRYATLRALVGADDLDGRILLVEWLRSREQYSLALSEVEAVLAKDPLHPRARNLRVWLAQQVELESRRQAAEGESADDTGAKERFAARQEAKRSFPLLSAKDINTIRVYEIDLKHPPRMLIRRETIDQLIRGYAESPLIPGTVEGREALYRKRPEAVLELMFRLQARNLYNEVQVLDHPMAIQQFRTEVHGRWLINSCATAQCHGGQEAGRLWLYTDKPHSDETVYTNLLILDRFRTAEGKALINYAEPAKSPLLQMGVPTEISLFPHPDVPRTRGSRGWKPVFRSTSDRRFRDAIEWISGMYQPRPEYPIEYTPPVPKAAKPKPDR